VNNIKIKLAYSYMFYHFFNIYHVLILPRYSTLGIVRVIIITYIVNINAHARYTIHAVR